jgi:hypothetical protein
MMKLRARKAIGPGLCGALLVVLSARAQVPLAAARPPDGETLLEQQSARPGAAIIARELN